MATMLDVRVEGDGCWPDLGPEVTAVPMAKIVGAAALPAGTSDGRPSVTLRIETPDGRTILAQTTLRLFLLAAAAFRARYGDPPFTEELGRAAAGGST